MAEMRPATVADLIEGLRQLPQDAMVVMSRDAEGNGFSPIAVESGGAVDFSTGRYEAESTWSGEFHADRGPDDDDDPDGWGPSEAAVSAVCLWPTN